MGKQFGFDPIHFATVIAICLILGGITPPVGVLLFITQAIAKISMKEVLKYLLPFATVPWVVVLVLAYVPEMATFLPALMFPK